MNNTLSAWQLEHQRDERTQRVAETLGWTGPKILRVEQPHDPTAVRRQAQEQRRVERSTTGIRRMANGWAAIKSGRLVREFTGPGCKAAAILEAGTNEVIA